MDDTEAQRRVMELEYDSIQVELNVAQDECIELETINTELEIQIIDMGVELDKINAEMIEYKRLQINSSDITIRSNVTEQELSSILAGTWLSGLAPAYIQAEKDYNINAIYLVSITALESGWGTSRLAINKNNISGFQAYDKNPYEDAKHFNSKEECILTTARVLSENYIGDDLLSIKQIGDRYASDSRWSNKVSLIADNIYDKVR